MTNSEMIVRPLAVKANALRALSTAIVEAHGVPSADADVTSAHLVRANLRGVDTHGVLRLKGYIDRIEAGGNNPKPEIRTVQETSVSVVMDGDNCLGQVGGQAAMDAAIKKAKGSGIGIATMRNSNHYGMAAYYSMMPLAHDMIGISMTNVLACVAPTGGAEAVLGNDPLSIAFPSGKELPVVLDMAVSKSSWGKALVCNQEGSPLPEGCFTDSAGNPTLDPAAFLDGGTLLPIAGHKGYGLGLSISLLCDLLSGGPFDNDLPHLYKELDKPGGNSFFMMAIRVENFEDVARYKRRMDDTIRLIRSTPRAQGVGRIYLPGEIEHEAEAKRMAEGIPLDRALADQLRNLASEAGLDQSVYEFLE